MATGETQIGALELATGSGIGVSVTQIGALGLAIGSEIGVSVTQIGVSATATGLCRSTSSSLSSAIGGGAEASDGCSEKESGDQALASLWAACSGQVLLP